MKKERNVKLKIERLAVVKVFFIFLSFFWFISACRTDSVELLIGVLGSLFMLLVILPAIKRRYISKDSEEI